MQESNDVLAALMRRWWIVALGLYLGVMAGVVLAVFSTDTYTSSALVVVVPAGSVERYPGDAVNYAQAYARVATTPSVLDPALSDAGLRMPRELLKRSVSTSASPSSPMIEIIVRQPRATRAATLANAISSALIRYSDDVGAQTGFAVQRFAPATIATSPSRPSLVMNAVVGGVLGLLVGGMLAAMVDAVRTRRPADADEQLREWDEEELISAEAEGRLPTDRGAQGR